MVNQTVDEGCLSRATIGNEGSLFACDEACLSPATSVVCESRPGRDHRARGISLRMRGPLSLRCVSLRR
jgi:hypothetical protein